MGKSFANFMCKKFFHPSSFANIKRVWLAEQRVADETKKQEGLRAEYERDQDHYTNRQLMGDERVKHGLTFIYEPPKAYQKETETESEGKLKWKRAIPAKGSESLASGSTNEAAESAVRNVRCVRCQQMGHIPTDRECPMFKSSEDDKPTRGAVNQDQLVEDMRRDGYAFKQSVLGRSIENTNFNKDLVVTDDSDDGPPPEEAFLNSLTRKQKKKLLKKLNRMEKRHSGSVHKKKNHKKRREEESSSSDDDRRRHHNKQRKSEESSHESSSDDESSDGKRRRSVHERKHESRRGGKVSYKKGGREGSTSLEDERRQRKMEKTRSRKSRKCSDSRNESPDRKHHHVKHSGWIPEDISQGKDSYKRHRQEDAKSKEDKPRHSRKKQRRSRDSSEESSSSDEKRTKHRYSRHQR